MKASPYMTLAMMEAIGAFAVPPLGHRERLFEPPEPPKKCLLPGCEKNREGNKLYCCKAHFGEHAKMLRSKQ